MIKNSKVVYQSVPRGLPKVDETFKVVYEDIDIDNIKITHEELLVKIMYISIDPYTRWRMGDEDTKNIVSSFKIGSPIRSGAIAQVLKSKNDQYEVGDFVITIGDWAKYSIVDVNVTEPIPKERNAQIPLSYYLSITGILGATAYVGLHTICEPIKRGETIFISAASGAVGQIVGQYSKLLGLNVVGSAGSDEKVDFLLNELKFDSAFNYKNEKNFVSVLKQHCPNGIDIYFDNVGGKMLDAVLEVANSECRISVCGMISQYNNSNNRDGLHNSMNILSKRIKMQGFGVAFRRDLWPKSNQIFSNYLKEGKIQYKEDLSFGIESLPGAFIDMLQGRNFGKAIVKVDDI
ncbi:NAD(P)-binding protein [Neoconidiobolus thromboides FSU 785]|nr:NAD(P)-binding protein [Neoconidiobolus thromboides FSU 785]